MREEDDEAEFEKMMIEDEGVELRIRDADNLSSMTHSTLSGEHQMMPMVVPSPAKEHDRFIPQRNGANAARNFEAKEFLFA